MKARKISLLVLSLILIVLEALPYGVICNFATEDGEPLRKTFSYFDFIPFGYANFGPFLTAFISVCLLTCLVILFFKSSKRLDGAIVILSLLGTFTSLMPFFSGVRYVSVIGVMITIVLLVMSVISIINKFKKQKAF